MSKRPKYNIYINQNAGTYQDIGSDGFQELLAESDIKIEACHVLPPQELFDQLSNEDGSIPILIGGGDGTIRSATQILGQKDIPFGIIPFGTMNLLARDLDIPLQVKDALTIYGKDSKEIKIDIGYANDHHFLCNASIGVVPATAEFREELRDHNEPFLIPKLAHYVVDHLDARYRRKYKILINGDMIKVRTASLVIASNAYDHTRNWLETSLKRAFVDKGILTVYTAQPSNFWERLRLVLKLGAGGWQNDPMIKSWKGLSMIVHGRKPHEKVSVDGEIMTLDMPIKFEIKQKALSVLVPEKKELP